MSLESVHKLIKIVAFLLLISSGFTLEKKIKLINKNINYYLIGKYDRFPDQNVIFVTIVKTNGLIAASVLASLGAYVCKIKLFLKNY